ncbi:23S rRNA (pseudouridine(1915)-N(3))-methyltransferase RlmH [Inhella crocodyli]|uniref:Ribosomal RNA large subunit methyltransferase H n=1 Tax=Inhella crocodyli TaxID=2499851 RepID=A0A3S2US29_9BURK|nr:23S rRNA (pseudouridine(1915)-N(3))-methyltransferase RlmH [Inhella crocodyli]RVT83101.1 23S rRNA (pseudouridine(1915)-N(3))-methyltransferase RlmH [Inhella crocodyli]
MQLLLLAVGQRLPAWADEATADLVKRFPPDLPLVLKTAKAEPRTTGKTAAQMMAAEAQRLQDATPKGARRVVLDERGERQTSVQLAERLERWKADGRDVVLYMGGPDGLAAELKDAADEKLRLSDLTLPHALARVLLVEALYRAWSITAGHPYHRE